MENISFTDQNSFCTKTEMNLFLRNKIRLSLRIIFNKCFFLLETVVPIFHWNDKREEGIIVSQFVIVCDTTYWSCYTFCDSYWLRNVMEVLGFCKQFQLVYSFQFTVTNKACLLRNIFTSVHHNKRLSNIGECFILD